MNDNQETQPQSDQESNFAPEIILSEHQQNFISALKTAIDQANLPNWIDEHENQEFNCLTIGYNTPELDLSILRTLFANAYIRGIDSNPRASTDIFPLKENVELFAGEQGDACSATAYGNRMYELMIWRNPELAKMTKFSIAGSVPDKILAKTRQHLETNGILVITTGEGDSNSQQYQYNVLRTLLPKHGFSFTEVDNLRRTHPAFPEEKFFIATKNPTGNT